MIIRMIIDFLNRSRGPHRCAAGDDAVIWSAAGHSECCTCGHEWEPGEVIGYVTQAYVKFSDGTVAHCPGTRLACILCVDEQRVKGDLSLRWKENS